MSIKKLLGEKVKRLRKMRGYTQEQFAEMIDITPRNLNRIESGENFVTSETLDKIILSLNVPSDILFSFEHLKGETEIVSEIYTYIDKIKNNQKLLEKTHRLLRIIAEDEF
ncbi:helix-turn-helix transcriptional regulator [bacterium]|nr:helix-turn-helix transcriptional regulator [bacterium]MBR1618353.1 helix-turn-helix transcriptional regulator [bacterium]